MDLTELDKPLRDFVFVRANPKKNAIREIAPGVKLVMDQTYEPHSMTHVTQDGIIKYIPRGFTQDYLAELPSKAIDLEVGDHVYGHHFLCDDRVSNTGIDSNGDGLYYIKYGELYCKVRAGDITMIGEWNLVDPVKVEAPETSIPGMVTQLKDKKEPLKGTAVHINESLRALGITEGDEIYFDPDSDYEMMVDGKMYYRMENYFILGKTNEE